MTDIWELESPSQDIAADEISMVVDKALNHDRKAINYLRKLWDGESWESIKQKLATEGSAWYVWWMDGVSHHLCIQNNIPWNVR